MDRLTRAVAAIEADGFHLAMLAAVAARSDALGQLAPLFQCMACEFLRREQQVKQQV